MQQTLQKGPSYKHTVTPFDWSERLHITDLEGGGEKMIRKRRKTGRPHKGSNRVIHTHTGFFLLIVLLPPKCTYWRSMYYPLSESGVMGVAFWGNGGQKAFMLTSISSTAPTAQFQSVYSG